MVTLEDAKALLCKKRHDSFAIGEEHESDGNSILCKWRSDSFADMSAELPQIQTCAEREIERHRHMPLSSAASTTSSTSTHDSVLRANRRSEVAYLEALAAHANRCESSGQSTMSTRPGRKPRDAARNGRRSTLGATSGATSSASASAARVDSSTAEDAPKENERYEAMQIVSREAAIREALEWEMISACNNGQLHNVPLQLAGLQVPASSSTQPSPARARGSAQPLQQTSRRSMTPRSRANLQLQPPQKLMPVTAQRSSSFGAESFRQADISKLQSASSFSKSIVTPRSMSFGQLPAAVTPRSMSFGQVPAAVVTAPMGRSASFGQIDSYRVAARSRQASPASSRSVSFDHGQAVQRRRSNSVSLVAPVVQSPSFSSISLPPGQALGAPVTPLPSSAAMSRAVNLVEEQAQLAARLNVAAEMIDNMQLDHSVLDEAKRLTELHKLRQAQQQRRQTQASPRIGHSQQSPRTAVPLPAYQRSTPKESARSRSGSGGLFWKPPPEAAQLCARCPSLDLPPGAQGLVQMGTVTRIPSTSSFELSKLSGCAELRMPPSPLRQPV